MQGVEGSSNDKMDKILQAHQHYVDIFKPRFVLPVDGDTLRLAQSSRIPQATYFEEHQTMKNKDFSNRQTSECKNREEPRMSTGDNPEEPRTSACRNPEELRTLASQSFERRVSITRQQTSANDYPADGYTSPIRSTKGPKRLASSKTKELPKSGAESSDENAPEARSTRQARKPMPSCVRSQPANAEYNIGNIDRPDSKPVFQRF